MTSEAAGVSTSAVEVQAVSPRGLWLWVMDCEYFLSTEQFPWFAAASVRDVYHVELHHGHLLRWPALDVDLELQSLAAPDQWPLVWHDEASVADSG